MPNADSNVTLPTMAEEVRQQPRVVLELSASGNVIMESYVNGQRQRLTLDPGLEWWQVIDELKRKQREIAAKPIARVSYGTQLPEAKKHPIGPANAQRQRKPGIAATDTADRQRVCHCGRQWPLPMMQAKCNGCPGPTGAGKIVKEPKPAPIASSSDLL